MKSLFLWGTRHSLKQTLKQCMKNYVKPGKKKHISGVELKSFVEKSMKLISEIDFSSVDIESKLFFSKIVVENDHTVINRLRNLNYHRGFSFSVCFVSFYTNGSFACVITSMYSVVQCLNSY